jgi:DNA-binding PadR family transcriptional regulator
MHGEAHGYQVRQDLRMWAAERWANVKPGSIYHALKKMAADSLLETVHTEESDLGPDRVVYRITEHGEGEFFYLLNKGISDAEGGPAMFNAALTFITALDRGTLTYLLKTRIQQLQSAVDSTELMIGNMIAAADGERGKPPHVKELFTRWAVISSAEATWLRDLVARLEAGEYNLAGEHPHAFGTPPAR